MTRKDFQLIADAVAGMRRWTLVTDTGVKMAITKEEVVNELARHLATTNPNFKWDKFVDACGN